jgi:hypothetical protein|tara:strand:+ start:215311 stop:215826 length:516 start_codon:yes stop_codon:yes gene_type:complete
MHKSAQPNNTLAGCLRAGPAPHKTIKSTFASTLNRNFFHLDLRKKYAVMTFAIGIFVTLSSSMHLDALSMPSLLTRLDMAGFIFAALPFLAILYMAERIIRGYKATRTQLNPFYNFIFVAPFGIIAVLDSGLINASYNVINIFAFALSAGLLWPTKKRRCYYAKKHIDKRT